MAWKIKLRGMAFAAMAAVTALYASGYAHAQTFPDRQVTLIVPASAGGATDVAARLMAKYLSGKYGQNFIVENKAAGGGITAALSVSTSPADGSILLFGTHSNIITPLTVKDTDHDVQKDLTPITAISENPFTVMVRSSSDIKTAADLVKYAKENTFTWGLGGFATPGHLGIEHFMEVAGFKGLIVPYSGESNVVNALLAGEVDSMFASPTAAQSALDSGKARALATATKEPLAKFPGVPTLTAEGFAVEAGSWFALWGPKDMSPELVSQIHKVFTDALKDPALVAQITELGMTIIASDSPAAFADFVKKSAEDDEAAIKKLGLYKTK